MKNRSDSGSESFSGILRESRETIKKQISSKVDEYMKDSKDVCDRLDETTVKIDSVAEEFKVTNSELMLARADLENRIKNITVDTNRYRKITMVIGVIGLVLLIIMLFRMSTLEDKMAAYEFELKNTAIISDSLSVMLNSNYTNQQLIADEVHSLLDIVGQQEINTLKEELDSMNVSLVAIIEISKDSILSVTQENLRLSIALDSSLAHWKTDISQTLGTLGEKGAGLEDSLGAVTSDVDELRAFLENLNSGYSALKEDFDNYVDSVRTLQSVSSAGGV